MLTQPEVRNEVFAAILEDHSLMTEFLKQARESRHATAMIAQVAGEQQEMDHANCPLMKEASANASASPYAGEEKRTIKSLSDEEISKYKNGEGMGLAKIAELNQYPGPKHVLAAAKELALSKDQEAGAEKLYKTMHEQAVQIGSTIVEKEARLNTLFAEKNINQSALETALKELGRLQGELRFVHLDAHLGMQKLLTSDQLQKYDKLRGYQNAHLGH
jgi:Spy/CpxP family protein refolding chaperone